MKFSSLFCGVAALTTSVSALVTSGAGGSTQTRYEIRELYTKYPRQYTLFLLAMQQYEQMSQATQTGYYQISGIHGVPRQNFDGVAQCSSCAGTDGYCPHDSILFLPWHRTYLALFEQELVSIAKNIASQYPAATKSDYVTAANLLRLPYWDWAAHPPNGGNALPIMMTQPTVTLQAPAGSTSIPNPLYQYTFSSTANLHYAPFTSWKNTLRYPTSNAASATSQESKAVTAFNNIRASLQDRVYNLFSNCKTYLDVGLSVKSGSTDSCSASFEGIHNTIHTTSGGPAQKTPTKISGGHMTYLSTAAFDPIFWLHHCNVDRLFTLWQAIYPNSYGASQNNLGTPTWTYPKGADLNANSNLTPFHSNAAGAFWNTNTVKSTKTFAYTYPEFVDSSGSQAAIQSYVNKLYGPSATATAGSSKRTPIPEPGSSPLKSVLGSVVPVSAITANNGSLFQYVANIATSRYALQGSYNIFLFNGEPTTDNPADYLLDQNLIGPLGVLASSMSGMDVITVGSIPLTRTLTDAVAAGKLTDLTETSVVPYLISNLKWIVVGPDGEEVDSTTIPDFDVSVFGSTATAPTGDNLPVWSEFIPLTDVTKSILSGLTGTSTTATSATATATSTSTKTKGKGKGKATTTATGLLASATSKLGGVRRRRTVRL